MEVDILNRTDYSQEEYFELFDQFERKIEYHYIQTFRSPVVGQSSRIKSFYS